MLALMGREHGLERRDALALASVAVDLRVTQGVNGVKGVHAKHDADDPRLFRFTMSKAQKAHFIVVSEEYDPAWTVRLRPEIDEETAR